MVVLMALAVVIEQLIFQVDQGQEINLEQKG